MPPSPSVIDPLAEDDPVAAFNRARVSGALLSLRTSGTTAHPRRVSRTTTSWEASFPHVSRLTGIDATSRIWVPGPPTATMNLFALVHAEAVGAVVVDDPRAATHAQLTPLGLERALRSESLDPGMTVIVAGDALPPAVLERARDHDLTVHHYYGAAELSFVSWSADGAPMVPFPGVEVRVRDGIIWSRSPYLCIGYDSPEDGDDDGPLRWDQEGFATVGDVGDMSDGILAVRGRGDEAVTVAGVTVVVADVESVLRKAAAADVHVLGLPDERLGAVLVACVTDTTDVDRLRTVAHERLEPSQRPRHWYVIDAVPTTPAGKPDRARLREMLTST